MKDLGFCTHPISGRGIRVGAEIDDFGPTSVIGFWKGGGLSFTFEPENRDTTTPKGVVNKHVLMTCYGTGVPAPEMFDDLVVYPVIELGGA